MASTAVTSNTVSCGNPMFIQWLVIHSCYYESREFVPTATKTTSDPPKTSGTSLSSLVRNLNNLQNQRFDVFDGMIVRVASGTSLRPIECMELLLATSDPSNSLAVDKSSVVLFVGVCNSSPLPYTISVNCISFGSKPLQSK
ncbi:hypothetical protein NE237_010096 [Protea cynaroides]|uniref:Uncharacterized protein n=1 Tax=Protea cynaroides TaxID=273540 RepID=A0A9Q0KZ35_9MAGN|nr:hypothetical protein NE237_010096 [Protea cynaroides]